MKPTTIPAFLRMFYPSLLWQMPEGNKRLYLTFDDGPNPEVTPVVLDLLKSYSAHATFFCVGDNVRKYPETYQQVLSHGHLTGNHSYNHLNGWKTSLNTYYENVVSTKQYIDSEWFRPPYGRITPSQIQALKKEFKIVMWSVLSYDFDAETSKEQCINNVLTNLNDGAIIVFHDSRKAVKNMIPALEATLKEGIARGFSFERIDR
jgi:peptidoglycan-N-acetylglucosamine deacetylase